MFSTPAPYEVEWIDKDEGINTIIVHARSASLAEDKAEKLLMKRKDFARIEWVELVE